MNWDDYDAFCQVIEHGSFTAAARAMDRPKSSLSASVNRLELQLETRLLERTTRRLRLTEAGEALFRDISKPFSDLREIASNAIAKGNAVRGTLRIAAPYEFGAHHLAEVACEVMTRYPDLKITIDVSHASIDLFVENYDIVFSAQDQKFSPSSVVTRKVYSLRRGLFAAPKLLRAYPKIAVPEDLICVPLLAGSNDSAWVIRDSNDAAVYVPVTAPRMRSSNAGIRLRAAIEGLGVMLVTTSFCRAAKRAGQLVAVLPEFKCEPLNIFAFLPGRHLRPPKVRIFLDSLKAYAEKSTHDGVHALAEDAA
jgi:DNA-binding transcriptional LysR family regulator